METPQPIDVSKLRGILGNAKAIMNKVESGNYETGHVDGRALTESTVDLVASERGGSTQNVAPRMVDNTPYYPNMAKSKLPEAIKKAMMETPIPQTAMKHTFSLEDVMDYEKDEKPIPAPTSRTQQRQPVYEQQRQPVYEQQSLNVSNDQIRQIIKEEMRSLVKEEMVEFFTKYFAKTLAEDTQRKVIQHLLKEGRLNIKKVNK